MSTNLKYSSLTGKILIKEKWDRKLKKLDKQRLEHLKSISTIYA